MTKISELNDLMIELLEAENGKQTSEFFKRSREIINEISDYAEQTYIFKSNKERGSILDGLSSQQIFVYMLDRVVNAPTFFYRNASVILIMPFVRKNWNKRSVSMENKNLYFSYETEHFYFDVYRAWKSHGQSMFRAGSYIKKQGNKRYYIDFEFFAEWDYKDEKEAFEEAKKWLIDYINNLSSELYYKERENNA